MAELLLYMLTGVFAGLAAGLFGVGGGLIIVPALTIGFDLASINVNNAVHLAIGTSLATIMFTSISATLAHHRRGAVLWPVFFDYAPGVLLGAAMGAWFASLISSDGLGQVFGIFELIVGIWMLWDRTPAAHRTLPGRMIVSGIGLIVGAVSALVGIGGGTMTVPFLIWCNQAPKKAVATSSASGFPIALSGACGFILTGWSEPGLPDWSLGYVYLPGVLLISIVSVLLAPLGARWAHALPSHILKRSFGVLLLVLALIMLLA